MKPADPLTDQLTTATMWLIFGVVSIAVLALLAKGVMLLMGAGCG